MGSINRFGQSRKYKSSDSPIQMLNGKFMARKYQKSKQLWAYADPMQIILNFLFAGAA